jgi:hypothetical protein
MSAARQLGWGDMLYHAIPRKLRRTRDVAKLVAELPAGDYIMQPWYRGRRIVWRPDLGQAFSINGKLVKTSPRLVNTWAPLDIWLVRGSHYALDVMLPKTFEDRILAFPAIRWSPVWSYQEVNEQLESQLSVVDHHKTFNGVVLKKTSVRYPWLPAGRQQLNGWWHITKPL